MHVVACPACLPACLPAVCLLSAALHPNDMLEKITNHRRSWQTKKGTTPCGGLNRQREGRVRRLGEKPNTIYPQLVSRLLGCPCSLSPCRPSLPIPASSLALASVLMRRHGIIPSAPNQLLRLRLIIKQGSGTSAQREGQAKRERDKGRARTN